MPTDELSEDELERISGGTSGDEAGTLKGIASNPTPPLPSTDAVAHELTHVVQGGAGRPRKP